MEKSFGKVELTEKTGHLSIWFSDTWDNTKFNLVNIVAINGN